MGAVNPMLFYLEYDQKAVANCIIYKPVVTLNGKFTEQNAVHLRAGAAEYIHVR